MWLKGLRAYAEKEVGQFATDVSMLDTSASYYVDGDIMRIIGQTPLEDIADSVLIKYPFLSKHVDKEICQVDCSRNGFVGVFFV